NTLWACMVLHSHLKSSESFDGRNLQEITKLLFQHLASIADQNFTLEGIRQCLWAELYFSPKDDTLVLYKRFNKRLLQENPPSSSWLHAQVSNRLALCLPEDQDFMYSIENEVQILSLLYVDIRVSKFKKKEDKYHSEGEYYFEIDGPAHNFVNNAAKEFIIKKYCNSSITRINVPALSQEHMCAEAVEQILCVLSAPQQHPCMQLEPPCLSTQSTVKQRKKSKKTTSTCFQDEPSSPPKFSVSTYAEQLLQYTIDEKGERARLANDITKKNAIQKITIALNVAKIREPLSDAQFETIVGYIRVCLFQSMREWFFCSETWQINIAQSDDEKQQDNFLSENKLIALLKPCCKAPKFTPTS
ncbi:MAG TPA: hypothetical protein VNX68_06690, partial [Nitrosopumilaceae archaeon]|nr:hypothetical protein [Nitrosopumilaceae archaeon]